jgi:hypothetical protein
MTTHSKDLCPCGSGKRYKHCHQKNDEARRRTLLLAAVGAVALIVLGAAFGPGLLARVTKPADRARAAAQADSAARAELAARSGAVGTQAATGAAAIGVVQPNGVAGPPLRDPAALQLTPPNSGALAPGEHPKDWEYDVAHNRHYDPREGHKHWHTGPPPVDPNAPTPAPTVVVTTPDGKPVTVTTTTTGK